MNKWNSVSIRHREYRQYWRYIWTVLVVYINVCDSISFLNIKVVYICIWIRWTFLMFCMQLNIGVKLIAYYSKLTKSCIFFIKYWCQINSRLLKTHKKLHILYKKSKLWQIITLYFSYIFSFRCWPYLVYFYCSNLSFSWNGGSLNQSTHSTEKR